MENNINTVTIPLSDYNLLKSNQETTKDLLNKATTELILLRSKETTNKIIVEKRLIDKFGNPEKSEKLILNIEDPEVSIKILDVISKVDNSELSKTIVEKEKEVKELKTRLNDALDVLENAERSYKYSNRRDDDTKKEEIRKLKKGFEETILDLEIDKETLSKALSDLKKDKTAQQLEIERVREADELKSKIAALEVYKEGVEHLNFFEYLNFKKTFNNAKKFMIDNPWADRVWNITRRALDNVDSFARMLKDVGKLPETKQCKYESHQAQYRAIYCNKCGFVTPCYI